MYLKQQCKLHQSFRHHLVAKDGTLNWILCVNLSWTILHQNTYCQEHAQHQQIYFPWACSFMLFIMVENHCVIVKVTLPSTRNLWKRLTQLSKLFFFIFQVYRNPKSYTSIVCVIMISRLVKLPHLLVMFLQMLKNM